MCWSCSMQLCRHLTAVPGPPLPSPVRGGLAEAAAFYRQDRQSPVVQRPLLQACSGYQSSVCCDEPSTVTPSDRHDVQSSSLFSSLPSSSSQSDHDQGPGPECHRDALRCVRHGQHEETAGGLQVPGSPHHRGPQLHLPGDPDPPWPSAHGPAIHQKIRSLPVPDGTRLSSTRTNQSSSSYRPVCLDEQGLQ